MGVGGAAGGGAAALAVGDTGDGARGILCGLGHGAQPIGRGFACRVGHVEIGRAAAEQQVFRGEPAPWVLRRKPRHRDGAFDKRVECGG